jgi:hypothetical protein
MPSKKKVTAKASKKAAKSKAKDAYGTAQPYVQRLIEDDDLRDNLREAYDAARDAYDRAAGAKRPSAVLEDKKLHSDLRNASESLRAATDALREPEKSKGGGFGRLLLIAIIGAIVALAVSEDLRKAVLDKLFGAEEEFEYTSSAATPPAPSSSGAQSSN